LYSKYKLTFSAQEYWKDDLYHFVKFLFKNLNSNNYHLN